MKKLLVIALGLCSLTLMAQELPNTTSLWESKPMNIPRKTGEEVIKEHLAVTRAGELYAAGNFNQSFTFAATSLEPIAESSYLLKFDAQGKEKWGIAFQGAVTITAITTNPTGDVYIAGVFASEIALGSTSGTSTTIKGIEGKELNSAFIAKYSAAGVLQHHNVFVPKPITTGELASDGGLPSFTINKMLFRDGKLYVTTTNIGAEIQSGSVSLIGTYMNVFDVMATFLQKTYVLELSAADCTIQRIIYAAGAKPGVALLSRAYSSSIAFDEAGKLYVGYVGSGNIDIEVGTRKESKQFYTQDGAFGYNYVLTAIDPANLSSTEKLYETRHQKEYNRCLISNLEVSGNDLVVFGSFNDSLAFNPAIKPIASNDGFISILDKSTLTVRRSTATKIKEGDNVTKVAESVSATLVASDLAYIVTTADSISTGKRNKAYAMAFPLKEGEPIRKELPENHFSVGASVSGDKVSWSVVNRKDKIITYLVSQLRQSSIQRTEHLSVTAYPTVTDNTVMLSDVCNVQVMSLSGELIFALKHTSKVNLGHLATGVYLLHITHKDGTGVVKVMKK